MSVLFSSTADFLNRNAKAISLLEDKRTLFRNESNSNLLKKKWKEVICANAQFDIYFREKSRDVYKTRYRRTSSISAEIVNYSWEAVGKWLEMGRRLSCGYEIEFLRSFKGF